MDKIVINLSDPNTARLSTFLALGWGLAFGATLYSLVDDIVKAVRGRKPKRKQAERRFIEPCASGMHIYTDGACTTCKAEEPTP